MANGFTILVTWPEMRDGKHVQETWYAHIPQQLDAVKAVQEACGALNDAKIEILGALSHDSLVEYRVPEDGVQRNKTLN